MANILAIDDDVEILAVIKKALEKEDADYLKELLKNGRELKEKLDNE